MQQPWNLSATKDYVPPRIDSALFPLTLSSQPRLPDPLPRFAHVLLLFSLPRLVTWRFKWIQSIRFVLTRMSHASPRNSHLTCSWCSVVLWWVPSFFARAFPRFPSSLPFWTADTQGTATGSFFLSHKMPGVKSSNSGCLAWKWKLEKELYLIVDNEL